MQAQAQWRENRAEGEVVRCYLHRYPGQRADRQGLAKRLGLAYRAPELANSLAGVPGE